jgi:uncharacterized protein YfdQ (DUF2303 family)
MMTEEAISALIEQGAAIATPKRNPGQHGDDYAALPDGWELAALPVAGAPQHPKAIVKLRDAASFVRYVNDHKAPRSRIYAAMEPASFLAVFDEFHTIDPEDADGVQGQADWREFRVQFQLPASREWQLWNNANRKHMSQQAFGEFLEDNLPDVVSPDGATLLEMAMNFEAATAGSYVANQRLQDGSHDLQWRADNNASGSVRLPASIELSIPVFENDAWRALQARLRYRITEGKLSIWYELVRPHKVIEAAFREAWQRIADDTAVPILLGSPE